MQIIFRGTGSTTPIPRAPRGGARGQSSRRHNCPQCRSRDRRDRRWPSALLLDRRVLIDALPMILDLLRSVHVDPARLRAVVLTHRHRDASGGLRRLPDGVERIHPRSSRPLRVDRYRLQPVRVPHDLRTWGYVINGRVAYFSDYSDVRPALPALRRAKIAVLDGSGWTRSFPSHQPMVQVIPQVKGIRGLRRILFTHNGHTRMPHATLQRRIRQLAGRRFGLAHHDADEGVTGDLTMQGHQRDVRASPATFNTTPYAMMPITS